MKKVFFGLATLAIVSLGSCSKSSSDCVKCTASGSSSTICKDQYNSAGTGVSWDTYKAGLLAGGCTATN